jgi:cell division protein ZapA (FtsZ GTPase activity inhibitor)
MTVAKRISKRRAHPHSGGRKSSPTNYRGARITFRQFRDLVLIRMADCATDYVDEYGRKRRPGTAPLYSIKKIAENEGYVFKANWLDRALDDLEYGDLVARDRSENDPDEDGYRAYLNTGGYERAQHLVRRYFDADNVTYAPPTRDSEVVKILDRSLQIPCAPGQRAGIRKAATRINREAERFRSSLGNVGEVRLLSYGSIASILKLETEKARVKATLADQVVEIDRNSPRLKKAIKDVELVIEELRKSNSLDQNIRDQALHELTAGLEILQSPRPTKLLLDRLLMRPLRYLANHAGPAVIGAVSATAVAALAKVLGFG